MGNAESRTCIGGLSEVFPIGSFVRVPRALTEHQLLEANRPNWTTEMNVSVGKIGLVVGGLYATHNAATVAFLVPDGDSGVVKPDFWNFHNDWLEAVEKADVPVDLQKELREYLYREISRSILLRIKENINVPHSALWGPAGSIVRVCCEKQESMQWSDMMDKTVSMRGILVTRDSDGDNLIMLPPPVCFYYYYKDAWLTAPESQVLDANVDDDAELLALQKTVLSAVQEAASESAQAAPAAPSTDQEDENSLSSMLNSLRSLRQSRKARENLLNLRDTLGGARTSLRCDSSEEENDSPTRSTALVLAGTETSASAYAQLKRRMDMLEARLTALERRDMLEARLTALERKEKNR